MKALHEPIPERDCVEDRPQLSAMLRLEPILPTRSPVPCARRFLADLHDSRIIETPHAPSDDACVLERGGNSERFRGTSLSQLQGAANGIAEFSCDSRFRRLPPIICENLRIKRFAFQTQESKIENLFENLAFPTI